MNSKISIGSMVGEDGITYDVDVQLNGRIVYRSDEFKNYRDAVIHAHDVRDEYDEPLEIWYPNGCIVTPGGKMISPSNK